MEKEIKQVDLSGGIVKIHKEKAKQFILYLIRWEASSPLLALCLKFLGFGVVINTIIANLIGGTIFYFIDKQIFGGRKDVSNGNERTIH